MVTYLIQMTACSGLLYAYYHFFLRNERFHQYNRFYLLLAMLLSCILPLLKIPVSVKDTQSNAIYSFMSTGEVVVVAAATPSFNYQQLLYILYVGVAVCLLLKLLTGLLEIIKIKKAGSTEAVEDIKLVRTAHPDAPFSFFKWLFWNNKIELQSGKGRQMFRHELYHIRSKHSLDLILTELIISLYWFNPFFYLYRKEVSTIQEFLADQYAANDSDVMSYAELLLMRAIGTQDHYLVNPFFHSQLKRRITMLTSSKKPQYQWLRKLLVLPVAAVSFCLFAFAYKEAKATSDTNELKPQTTMRDNIESAEVRPISDSVPFRKKFIVEGKEVSEKVFNALDVNKVKKVSVAKNEKTKVKTITVALKTDEELTQVAIDHSGSDKTDISTQVDKEAEYPGDWAVFLSRNLNPQVPVDNGAMPGNYTSTVQFVVDRAGNVSDVKAVSNVGFGMEAEAIRVIKRSGKWKPALNEDKEVTSYRRQSVTFQVFPKDNQPAPANRSHTSLEASQASAALAKEVEVFTKVETDAVYPGNWRAFLQKNLDASVPVEEGAAPGNYTTIIQFIVSRDGTISDIKPLTKIGYGMEAEAMRVIKASGKWKPAIQNKREVKAYRKQPITFQVTKS